MSSKNLTAGKTINKLTLISYDKKKYMWKCKCNCGKITYAIPNKLRKGQRKSCGCNNKANIVGKKFGKLTAVKFDADKQKWECLCECGKTTYCNSSLLKSGKRKSCGCASLALEEGDKFGRLTVIRHSSRRNAYECKCDCGNITYARTHSLKKGRHKSCGCLNNEPREHMRLPDNIGVKRDIMRGYKGAAKRRDYEFSLSENDFFNLIDLPCVYCGEKESMT